MKTGPKLNPNYGNGIFRRRIRIEAFDDPNSLLVSLEDCLHGFMLRVTHDGSKLCSAEAEVIRAPFDLCQNATAALQPAIGKSIDEIATSLRDFCPPSINCTHLQDMLQLAMHHFRSGNFTTQYDVIIPDQVNDQQNLKVYCNGILVHDWTIASGKIEVPTHLNGYPIMSGFFKWLSTKYTGSDFVSATVLQRGYFVSSSRRYDMDGMIRQPSLSPNKRGACYSFSEANINIAMGTPNVMRDFTDTPEQLLKFK